jgi:glycosyltransferase involved in cell wall biosynthesis
MTDDGASLNAARHPDPTNEEVRGRRRSLHIVYVVDSRMIGGGVHTYVNQMARALLALKQKVTVLYIVPPGHNRRSSSLEPWNVEYTTFSNTHYYVHKFEELLSRILGTSVRHTGRVRDVEYALALRRGVRNLARHGGDVDLVEIPEETPLPLIFRTLPYTVKLHSVDFTWRMQLGETMRQRDKRRMRRQTQLLRHARLVTAPSDAMANHIASVCSYPRPQIQVLPNPVDIDHFCPHVSKANVRTHDDAESGLLETFRPVSILYVGRLDRFKGMDTLARSTAMILVARSNVSIDIVGKETDDFSTEDFLAYVPSRLHGRIVFHGWISYGELPSYYRRASVCVVPSHWESFGYTAAEAMACGVPVVASRVGGLSDLVIDGCTGRLVRAGDPEALSIALLDLLCDPEKANVMGRNARERVVSLFAPQVIAQRSIQLYADAVRSEMYSR